MFTLTIDLTPAAIACTAEGQNTSTKAGNDDTFIDFDSEKTQMFRYRVSSLRHVFKALAVARESLIQINEEGMLMVDHMMHDEGKASAKIYVHFALRGWILKGRA